MALFPRPTRLGNNAHLSRFLAILPHRPGRATYFGMPNHVLEIAQPAIDRAAIAPVIRPYIRRTPVIRIDAGDLGLAGEPLTLKLEYLQHTGSFKPRGAFANLLTRAVPSAGVAAASGGNHGAAVAYAAMRLGIRTTIFVPSHTSPYTPARF